MTKDKELTAYEVISQQLDTVTQRLFSSDDWKEQQVLRKILAQMPKPKACEPPEWLKKPLAKTTFDATVTALVNTPPLAKRAALNVGRYLTTTEAAAYLGVTNQTLYSRQHRGSLPKFRRFRDGSVGYLKTNLDKFKKNQAAAALAKPVKEVKEREYQAWRVRDINNSPLINLPADNRMKYLYDLVVKLTTVAGGQLDLDTLEQQLHDKHALGSGDKRRWVTTYILLYNRENPQDRRVGLWPAKVPGQLRAANYQRVICTTPLAKSQEVG